MNDYVTLINTVGFPIFAFLLMYHLVRTTIKENSVAIRKLTIAIEKYDSQYRGDR